MDAINIKSLIDALKKEKKTSDDIERIYETISGLTFFNKFIADKLKDTNRETLKYICKAMKYERFNAGTFIFMQGDPSNNKFYVVLSGKVAIILKENMANMYKQSDSDKTGKEKKLKNFIVSNLMITQMQTDIVQNCAELKRKNEKNTMLNVLSRFSKRSSVFRAANRFSLSSGKGIRLEGANFYDQIELEAELNKIIEKHGHKARELAFGESFGEKALENNEARSASILCMTDCDLLVLEKDDYYSIFGEMKTKKVEFLSEMLPFQKNVVSSRTMEFLVQEFRDIVLPKGTVIITPEETPEKDPKIHLIQNGECIIEKLFVPTIQDRQKYGLKQCWVKICNIGRGNMIGDELIDDNKENYDFRVTVSSKALTALFIRMKEIKSHFPKEFILQINKTYEVKKVMREAIYAKILNEIIENKKNSMSLNFNPTFNLKDTLQLPNQNIINERRISTQTQSKPINLCLLKIKGSQTELDDDNSKEINKNSIMIHRGDNDIFQQSDELSDNIEKCFRTSLMTPKNARSNLVKRSISSSQNDFNKLTINTVGGILEQEVKAVRNRTQNRKYDNPEEYKFDFGAGDIKKFKKIYRERLFTPKEAFHKNSKKSDLTITDVYIDKFTLHKLRLSTFNDHIINSNPFYVHSQKLITNSMLNSDTSVNDSSNFQPKIIKGPACNISRNIPSAENTPNSENCTKIKKKFEPLKFPEFNNIINSIQSARYSQEAKQSYNIANERKSSVDILCCKSPNEFNLKVNTWALPNSNFYLNLRKKSKEKQGLTKKSIFYRPSN